MSLNIFHSYTTQPPLSSDNEVKDSVENKRYSYQPTPGSTSNNFDVMSLLSPSARDKYINNTS